MSLTEYIILFALGVVVLVVMRLAGCFPSRSTIPLP